MAWSACSSHTCRSSSPSPHLLRSAIHLRFGADSSSLAICSVTYAGRSGNRLSGECIALTFAWPFFGMASLQHHISTAPDWVNGASQPQCFLQCILAIQTFSQQFSWVHIRLFLEDIHANNPPQLLTRCGSSLPYAACACQMLSMLGLYDIAESRVTVAPTRLCLPRNVI